MPEATPPPYAHNLVSSLYAMKGMIESYLLKREEGRFQEGGETLEKSEEVLKRAYHQADQALRVAKRLGALLEENKATRKPSSSHLTQAWKSSLKLLEREFSFKTIEILERIPEKFPEIQCEEGDLKEILYHLIRNALQALAGKGKLVIRAQVSFSTQEEPFAEIQIADTGPGIPEPKLSRLFLPFYTTKPWREGSGLGLYLTRELVHRNHGRITASSFPAFGTTFTLEFPLAKPS